MRIRFRSSMQENLFLQFLPQTLIWWVKDEKELLWILCNLVNISDGELQHWAQPNLCSYPTGISYNFSPLFSKADGSRRTGPDWCTGARDKLTTMKQIPDKRRLHQLSHLLRTFFPMGEAVRIGDEKIPAEYQIGNFGFIVEFGLCVVSRT